MSASRVVVVNDDPVQLGLASTLLGRGGYHVSSFESPVAALQAVADGTPADLFVLDLHMPELDGWKLCRLLRSAEFAAHNRTPVLVISAIYAGEEVAALTRELGADAFLESPFEPADLLETAGRLLRGEAYERDRTLLLVEDDAGVRQPLARRFAQQGYRVVEEATVSGGRAAWLASRPDVVLLDHHLPDGTSLDLLEELARQRSRAAVLVMTGDPDPQLAVRLYACGADGYLRKPFEAAEAIAQVRSVVRQKALLHVGTVLEDRHLEQQAAERRRQQSRRLESLGLLAGGVAHEFNNLLVGILGNADLASLDVPAGSPAQASLDQITRLARRAAERTRQILAFTGKAGLESEELDLGQVVSSTLARLEPTLAARVDLAPGPALVVLRGDRERLSEVVLSLVMNALEALGDDTGRVRLDVGRRDLRPGEVAGGDQLGELKGGSYAWLEVTDDGCGMDEGTRSRMFDPFFSTKFTGRGLGLAAVLGIVRGHGGAVTVRTAPGEGTTVTVFLPAPRR